MAPNKKTILTLIIFLTTSSFFISLVILPFLNEIKNNSEIIINQKKEAALFETKITNLRNFENIYQIHQENLEKIETLFIDHKIPADIIKFTAFLRKIAYPSQTSIEILPSPPLVNFWPALIFQINSQGQFPDFLKFLNKLENSPWLIEILNLNVGRNEKGTETSLLIKVFTK